LIDNLLDCGLFEALPGAGPILAPRLYRYWVDRTPYDESRYLMALQRRSARLLKPAAQKVT